MWILTSEVERERICDVPWNFGNFPSNAFALPPVESHLKYIDKAVTTPANAERIQLGSNPSNPNPQVSSLYRDA